MNLKASLRTQCSANDKAIILKASLTFMHIILPSDTMFPRLCLNYPMGINIFLHISPCNRLLATARPILHIM
jgi:hypothetical protein